MRTRRFQRLVWMGAGVSLGLAIGIALAVGIWLGMRSHSSDSLAALPPELRLRVAKFGATPEDRARLKIEVGDPQAPPTPARLQTKTQRGRRDRLLKAVGDGSQA